MSDFKSLMAVAANLSMDELNARQIEVQSEADFLAEMLKMRKKLGERTTEQIKRKARREAKSEQKPNTVKRQTAVDDSTNVNNATTTPVNPPASSSSGEIPSLKDLFEKDSSERSERAR